MWFVWRESLCVLPLPDYLTLTRPPCSQWHRERGSRLTFFSVLLALAGERTCLQRWRAVRSLTLLTVSCDFPSAASHYPFRAPSAYPRGTMCNQLQLIANHSAPGLREPRPRPWSRLPRGPCALGPSAPEWAPGTWRTVATLSPRDGGGQKGGWVDQDRPITNPKKRQTQVQNGYFVGQFSETERRPCLFPSWRTRQIRGSRMNNWVEVWARVSK